MGCSFLALSTTVLRRGARAWGDESREGNAGSVLDWLAARGAHPAVQSGLPMILCSCEGRSISCERGLREYGWRSRPGVGASGFALRAPP
mmetsp:Transcript_37853/g.97931  ORF Transcript_37853/g.97931 Transcript_37853/m.97931 type:complete len:90 (-) Transcript_37853:46-315(-)